MNMNFIRRRFLIPLCAVLLLCTSCSNNLSGDKNSDSAAHLYSDSETTSSESILENDEDSVIVYVTQYGKKYHSYGCASLWNSCYELPLEDAVSQGYEPCSRCSPPRG